jgi:hypothetical protein
MDLNPVPVALKHVLRELCSIQHLAEEAVDDLREVLDDADAAGITRISSDAGRNRLPDSLIAEQAGRITPLTRRLLGQPQLVENLWRRVMAGFVLPGVGEEAK